MSRSADFAAALPPAKVLPFAGMLFRLAAALSLAGVLPLAGMVFGGGDVCRARVFRGLLRRAGGTCENSGGSSGNEGKFHGHGYLSVLGD